VYFHFWGNTQYTITKCYLARRKLTSNCSSVYTARK